MGWLSVLLGRCWLLVVLFAVLFWAKRHGLHKAIPVAKVKPMRRILDFMGPSRYIIDDHKLTISYHQVK